MLKSFKKPFIIISILALCVVIIPYLGAHIWFNSTSTWKYCVKDFETYRKDFEMLAEYCQAYTLHNGFLENGRTLFVYNSKERELLCDWENIEAPDEIKRGFEKIKVAFPHKDAQFDSITVDREKVYFETHNGLYSVVYSNKETPKLVDGVNRGKSKKIDNNWYHVVKK